VIGSFEIDEFFEGRSYLTEYVHGAGSIDDGVVRGLYDECGCDDIRQVFFEGVHYFAEFADAAEGISLVVDVFIFRGVGYELPAGGGAFDFFEESVDACD